MWMCGHMHRRTGSNLILRLSVLLVVMLLLVTPLYLVIRTAEAGSEIFDLFFRWRNAEIWGRTILLCVSVTLGTTVIAVPLAWLIASYILQTLLYVPFNGPTHGVKNTLFSISIKPFPRQNIATFYHHLFFIIINI